MLRRIQNCYLKDQLDGHGTNLLVKVSAGEERRAKLFKKKQDRLMKATSKIITYFKKGP